VPWVVELEERLKASLFRLLAMQRRGEFMRRAHIPSGICSTFVRRTMIERMQIFNAVDDQRVFGIFL
jgi:hypothetical protein